MLTTKIKFDFVNKFALWLVISGLITAAGVVSIAVQDLNWAIDFTGGQKLRYRLPEKIEPKEIAPFLDALEIEHDAVQIIEEAGGALFFRVRIAVPSSEAKSAAHEAKIERLKADLYLKYGKNLDPKRTVHAFKIEEKYLSQVLEGHGLSAEDVEIAGDQRNEVVIKKDLTGKASDNLRGDLYAAFGGYQQFDSEMKVHPAFGLELQKRALWAMVMASVCILIYISVRFKFWFAVPAVIAVIHDCVLTTSFFSLLRLEVNVNAVAVLLTVFGYSINDTIVIFDRVRENMAKDRRVALDVVFNKSIWETLARSINTILTTLVSILFLMLFGGANVHDLTVGLFIGILWGGYSSIFIAAPLAYVFLKPREKERKASGAGGLETPDRPAARRAEPAAAPTPRTVLPEGKPREKREPAAAAGLQLKSETASDDDSGKKSSGEKKKVKKARRR